MGNAVADALFVRINTMKKYFTQHHFLLLSLIKIYFIKSGAG